MKPEKGIQFFIKFSNIKFNQNRFIRCRTDSYVQTDGWRVRRVANATKKREEKKGGIKEGRKDRRKK
jgi:hypothetical protein